MANADVEVTKVVPASDVLVGDEIVITINALNHGPNPATGIEITDQLPAGFDFVSASATQGAYDAATGIWSVGSLAVGTAAQLTMTVLVTEPGPITNLAAKTDQNEPDPNTSQRFRGWEHGGGAGSGSRRRDGRRSPRRRRWARR